MPMCDNCNEHIYGISRKGEKNWYHSATDSPWCRGTNLRAMPEEIEGSNAVE